MDGLDSGDYEISVVPPPDTEAVGDGVLDVTITDAGELRGGLDFQLQAEEVGPTDSPSESPSTSASPTTVPTAVEGGSTSSGPGGAALWVALVGALLLAAGSGLVLATGRHRRH